MVCIDYEAMKYLCQTKQLIFFKNDCLLNQKFKSLRVVPEPDAHENLKHRGVMGRINLNEVDCLLFHTDGVRINFESTNKNGT